MSMNSKIPPTVFQAFPVLESSEIVAMIVRPDTSFRIYRSPRGKLLTLVATDYADPVDQSSELSRSTSGRLIFDWLLKPYALDSYCLPVLELDQIDAKFFVVAPCGSYQLYYYVAKLQLCQHYCGTSFPAGA